jgi:N-carbamoylputrescine amidase
LEESKNTIKDGEGEMRLRVGLAQMQFAPLRVEDNLKKAERLVEQCVNGGAELVVLPEMFSTGFYTMEELMDEAESLGSGPTVDWLRSLAVHRKVHLTCSLYERHEGHYYNTMVMVGGGRSAAVLQKMESHVDGTDCLAAER